MLATSRSLLLLLGVALLAAVGGDEPTAGLRGRDVGATRHRGRRLFYWQSILFSLGVCDEYSSHPGPLCPKCKWEKECTGRGPCPHFCYNRCACQYAELVASSAAGNIVPGNYPCKSDSSSPDVSSVPSSLTLLSSSQRGIIHLPVL